MYWGPVDPSPPSPPSKQRVWKSPVNRGLNIMKYCYEYIPSIERQKSFQIGRKETFYIPKSRISLNYSSVKTSTNIICCKYFSIFLFLCSIY